MLAIPCCGDNGDESNVRYRDADDARAGVLEPPPSVGLGVAGGVKLCGKKGDVDVVATDDDDAEPDLLVAEGAEGNVNDMAVGG